MTAARVAMMPPEIVSDIDSMIEIIDADRHLTRLVFRS
jgi:hypothetical protein